MNDEVRPLVFQFLVPTFLSVFSVTSVAKTPSLHVRSNLVAPSLRAESPEHTSSLPDTREQPDNELLHSVARGDESALAAIYDRYSSILLGLLLRILHSRGEAEDVLQEVFLQVWRRAADFDESRGRAFTWLVTLARSRAIDRLRALDARSRAATAS